MSKLWGGRFTGETDPIMEKFNTSIGFDRILWKADIVGSKEYAKALCSCGILTNDEGQKICAGLDKVFEEWNSATFEMRSGDEDIHTANERRLSEIIGKEIGGKLHTGRSRNDQVATDMRIWLREEIDEIRSSLCEIILAGCEKSEQHVNILQAGYTHLQPAQPIRFSHWLMSYVIPLLRDTERIAEIRNRVNILSLGSGALAGHPFQINRKELAKNLGFDDISLNSLDATCDRDFVIEMLNWSSLLMIHLSQFAEDLIINNLHKTIKLSDAYCTGSSLMPQKKNPDALELLRGKAGRVLGNAVGFSCTLKGLPRAYNKDLQEDKEPLFDTVNTVKDCLSILLGIISTMEPNETKLRDTLQPEMFATDLAEYLVRKGLPFRETHEIAGIYLLVSFVFYRIFYRESCEVSRK
jgi:argininosuccinate lyase